MKIKNFKISGYYTSQKRQFNFTRCVRALDKEKALEKIYSILNIGRSRSEVKITDVMEIPASQISNKLLRKIALEQKPSILGKE